MVVEMPKDSPSVDGGFVRVGVCVDVVAVVVCNEEEKNDATVQETQHPVGCFAHGGQEQMDINSRFIGHFRRPTMVTNEHMGIPSPGCRLHRLDPTLWPCAAVTDMAILLCVCNHLGFIGECDRYD
jgi:hypothetical protein